MKGDSLGERSAGQLGLTGILLWAGEDRDEEELFGDAQGREVDPLSMSWLALNKFFDLQKRIADILSA